MDKLQAIFPVIKSTDGFQLELPLTNEQMQRLREYFASEASNNETANEFILRKIVGKRLEQIEVSESRLIRIRLDLAKAFIAGGVKMGDDVAHAVNTVITKCILNKNQ